MQTPTKQTKLPLKARWAQLLSEYSEEEKIEGDAQMLMFQFLSEVEKHMEAKGIDRKMLAAKIGTSAGYLTQLWRGHKYLSFTTLVKMQRALGIRFEVRVGTHK